ncbi:pre-mRNA-splicing factor ATP-dependent RNA helicase prp22 [Coprinopsis cinerea okayama7|uniref:RNA helicase n=1 Tax=Coprinopsis cinerea (strain Okayama-7 / 130 / ATCC MYA-4618 / FGSC 9003) TaxID=240176 RepID=A8N1T8_COPC7|nr:pre-mRNA-splicing factor ATP-dependent RNA helicase prp22 [Coprinopsis cinerea okayama7\|eukprot:XP_001828837.2 pre-mRNA-splicing factor ATP-dependent RNA helicase prp22 [Coprinopsis cinerea okayama7\
MPPKKKKTQLKPVARGFATTSVPKKAVPTATTVEEPAPTIEGKSNDIPNATGDGVEKPTSLPGPFSPDPVDVQHQASQAIMEKHQEKLEKEITRTIKLIEADRRHSQTFPSLELEAQIKERIFDLIHESRRWDDQKPLDDSEEKIITRLALTYGVLRRLGFAENIVDECLRSISGVDLDEAYEWLAINCSEEELGARFRDPQEPPKTPRTPQGSFGVSSTPTTPIPSLTSKLKALDANAAVFVPRGLQTPDSSDAQSVAGSENNMRRSDSASEPPSSAGPSQPASDDESEGPSGDDDDPNGEYVRLKLKYHELQTLRRLKEYDPKLRRLKERIETVKQDILFDERAADRDFLSRRAKFDQDFLSGKLTQTPIRTKPVRKSKQPSKPKTPSTPDDDDEPSLGLLDLLDPQPETTTDGRVVSIREMGMPKQWSSRTPKLLLRDCVQKLDRYAAVSYSIVSGGSRAVRAAVSVVWDGKKRDDWVMEDVACPDEAQAEQYIATVALHALTYPPTDGFAAGSILLGASHTFFRALPPAFRDLWDELEAVRKARDDETNAALWSKLRSLVEEKKAMADKAQGSMGRASNGQPVAGKSKVVSEPRDVVDPQLAEAFAARQASAAYQEMLAQRNSLPIAAYRETIINILESSQVLVLSGETGCGKSTQVPAFILEHSLSQGKPCRVYCTEPRRISAVSLAQRVSRELGEPANVVGTSNSLVGYSIRLESNISRNTRLAYVTNGIALRMLEGGSASNGQGTAFDEITHIIIDEVHERTIESDFLLIVLKSLIRERPDLKVILMSATVDAEKISDYFDRCPTLHVPGRTFPVDVRFLEDAVEFTNWNITENSPYARRQGDKYWKGKNRPDWREELQIRDEDDEDDDTTDKDGIKLEKRYSPPTISTLNLIDERVIPYDLILRLLEELCFGNPDYLTYSSAILVFMPGLGEIRRLHDMLSEHPQFGSNDFRLYPLHSTLSSENQGAVFDVPPPGIRKIVIATNIAETGITIPDITCVIDSGKHREMRRVRQISRLVESFIAKSNAAQRRGRAGRVQRGLCFHLFTKMRHDAQMADNPLPEMMRLSLSDLALKIKIMKVKLGSSIEDVLSRALDPPIAINVQRAISMLVEVRALTPSQDITPLGQLLSKLPTDVHLGKFLLVATVFRCLDPALTIAAVLNSKSPFVTPLGLEQEADRAKNSFRIENSDFLTLHNAYSSWRNACNNPAVSIRKFCHTNYLSHQNLQQIEELRQQFLGFLVDMSFIRVDRSFVRELSRSRYNRNRTRFVNLPPEYDVNSKNFALVNAALVAGLYPKVLSIDPRSGQMKTISNNQAVSFHPSSVNFGKRASDFGVHHLGYFTLMHSKKLYAWETGPVDDLAMLLLCGETDFKLATNSASIDRKIRFQLSPKMNVALKILREELIKLLSMQFAGQPMVESQVRWYELAMMVLGKVKPAEGRAEQQTSITIVN